MAIWGWLNLKPKEDVMYTPEGHDEHISPLIWQSLGGGGGGGGNKGGAEGHHKVFKWK